MIRLVAIMAGIAGVVFILAQAAAIREQATVASAAWSVPAAVVLATAALGPVVAGMLAPLHWVRMTVATYAVLYALIVLSGFAAYPRGALDWGDWPWTSAVGGAAAAMVAAVASGKLAWLHYVALVVLMVAQMAWATGGLWLRLLTAEISGSMALAVVLVTAVLALRRGAALVDRETAAMWHASARAAASRASSEERARGNALVHDSVLSALVLAGQGHAGEEAVKAARHGLLAIRGLKHPAERPSDLAPDAAAALIVPRHVGAFGIEHRIVVGGGKPVPGAVVEAISAAVAEAVSNSLRHAGADGREVARRIHGRIAPQRIAVSITDDGTGFDPRKVSPRRMGIALSIKERMRQVPGGHAEVISAPGRGTTVRIDWRAG
ncbi:sensor histidine kinase [Lolliginicoccus suaedae]|uniref:sensor histidine kinase n=1 Tax=Lolliginicoccus suaedae TaxID=2605429 RepID=UPI0011F02B7E|nr:ATP-binding protein [Lolliginicoccus suaedae]